MALLLLVALLPITQGLSPSATLWASNRGELLNLLNHPLQIQLATGDLPYGSFLRLCEDRATILDGLVAAAGTSPAAAGLAAARTANGDAVAALRSAAAAAGKSIEADGVACYGCGGPHLNMDCPDELAPSNAARALAAVVRTSGGAASLAGVGDYPSSLAAVAAVTRAYGWACATALDAELGPSAYDGWLEAHGAAFSAVGAAAERALDGACDDAEAARPAYVAALSALYNYVDAEASTAGLKGSGAALEDARRGLDAVEPGFLAAQDRNANFVSDLKRELVGGADAREKAAGDKMAAAAAYLAKKGGAPGDARAKAAAYLAAKERAP